MGRPSKYPLEFRQAAVELVRTSGKPIAEIARDLGVNDGTLGNWITVDRAARGEQPSETVSESEPSERWCGWSSRVSATRRCSPARSPLRRTRTPWRLTCAPRGCRTPIWWAARSSLDWSWRWPVAASGAARRVSTLTGLGPRRRRRCSVGRSPPRWLWCGPSRRCPPCWPHAAQTGGAHRPAGAIVSATLGAAGAFRAVGAAWACRRAGEHPGDQGARKRAGPAGRAGWLAARSPMLLVWGKQDTVTVPSRGVLA